MVGPSTLKLTQQAEGELDRYLRRVKAALGANPAIDAEEIERDIRGHIEAELAQSAAPVNERQLRVVLEQLGAPSQLVPTDDLPVWRQVLVRLRSGPEDWRLAYLTFALFVAGFVTAPWIGPVLVLASVPVARATLGLLDSEGEGVGARRWLVYPPLVGAYAILAFGLFLGVPALLTVGADPSVQPEVRQWLPEPLWVSLPLAIAAGAGAWWTILGLFLARTTRVVQLVFWPFAESFERRHAMRIAKVGFGIAVIAASALALSARMG